MSRGVLVYAHNNGAIEYDKLALICAFLIKRNMGVPVALVTDDRTYLQLKDAPVKFLSVFDDIIINPIPETKNFRSYNNGKETLKVAYKNVDRPSCFDVSPFDETILVDSDYLVLNDALNALWGSASDIRMTRSAKVIGNFKEVKHFKRIEDSSCPMYWATVVYFKKTKQAKSFFDLVSHIKDNYAFYGQLYRFDTSQYRNDFTFSVAAHIMNGNIEQYGLVSGLHEPSMLCVFDPCGLIKVQDCDSMVFSAPREDSIVPVRINTNIHCMNKASILEHQHMFWGMM